MRELGHSYGRQMSMPSTDAPRPFTARWWTGGRGFGGVAQWPNPSIAVWAIATVLGWMDVGGRSGEQLISGVACGALLVWSLDELLRGVSPIRRTMGAAVLVLIALRWAG